MPKVTTRYKNIWGKSPEKKPERPITTAKPELRKKDGRRLPLKSPKDKL